MPKTSLSLPHLATAIRIAIKASGRKRAPSHTRVLQRLATDRQYRSRASHFPPVIDAYNSLIAGGAK